MDSRSTDPANATTAETGVSLEAIVDFVALPVWVIDPDGLVILANPAAIAATGFDDESEILRPRTATRTVHYKRPDGSPFPPAECPLLEARLSGVTVHLAEDWFVRRDGTHVPGLGTPPCRSTCRPGAAWS